MRWRLLIVGVVVLCTAGLTGAGSALAQPTAPGHVAAAPTATPIYAFNSGLVLTAGAGTSGAKVTAAADKTGAGQRWLLESDGTIRLSANSNICLDVPAFNYTSGVQLDAYTCQGSANEQFTRAAPSASTPVLAIKPTAHPSLCLNVKGGLATGAAVILYACGAATTNYINEAWSSTDLYGSASEIPSWAGYPLNASGGGGAGAAAVAWPDSNTLNEFWQKTIVTISGFGPELEFQPIYNTSLCLAPQGSETLRAPIVLAGCTGAAVQAFAAPMVNANSNASTYFVTTHDARYCLNYQGGSAQGHRAILFTCQGTGNDLWQTSLDLETSISQDFGTLGLDGDAYTSDSQPVLSVSGTGSGASAVIVANSFYPASQVWTDLSPAGSTSVTPGSPANPDGSFSLHPLSDVSLCLTVPGANYAAGQPLDLETCDGQQDQDFFRAPTAAGSGYQELISDGDGQLCISAPAVEAPGDRAELDPCDSQGDQAWSSYWYGFFGWPGPGTTIMPDPEQLPTAGQPALGLTGIGSAGGSAAVEPQRIGATSQLWHVMAQSTDQHQAIVPLYDTGWCLGAPAGSPAGTAVTASACDNQTDQGFTEREAGDAPGGNSQQFIWAANPSLCLTRGPADADGTTPIVLATCSATDTSDLWDLSN